MNSSVNVREEAQKKGLGGVAFPEAGLAHRKHFVRVYHFIINNDLIIYPVYTISGDVYTLSVPEIQISSIVCR